MSRLVDYLISTDFGVSARRRDRTVFQLIFGTREALVQIFDAVDERVFYLRDSFPETPIEQFAFGLFTQWVPQEVPVVPNMPDLAISPVTAHRIQATKREQASTTSGTPRTQRAPSLVEPLSTTPESHRSEPEDLNVENGELYVSDSESEGPYGQAPERGRDSEEEHTWRRERSRPRDRSRRQIPSAPSYGFGGPSAYTVQRTPPYGDPVLMYSDGTTGYLYPSLTPGYTSEPSRRPPPFPQSQTWFPKLVVIEDLNSKLVSDSTYMSPTLARHDTTSSEYYRFVDVGGPKSPCCPSC